MKNEERTSMTSGPTMSTDPNSPNHCPKCHISWSYCDCEETADVTELRKENVQLKLQLEEMRARKNGAYDERNKLVALLARIYPSGIAKTSIEGWSEDWNGCVYIDLPNGQASWHYHDSQAYLFEALPPYTKSWDGHTTEQKYERVMLLLAGMSINGQKPVGLPISAFPRLQEEIRKGIEDGSLQFS